MLILLIRHAEAAEQDPERYPDDSLRPLVGKGRKAQRRISAELRKRKLIPRRVFSSPWKRAWQTARIVVDAMPRKRSRRVRCEALAGPPDLKALAREIGAVDDEEILALVGHEPWMSRLASLMLAGEGTALSVDYPKSGVMGIEAERIGPGAGTLRFFLVPA